MRSRGVKRLTVWAVAAVLALTIAFAVVAMGTRRPPYRFLTEATFGGVTFNEQVPNTRCLRTFHLDGKYDTVAIAARTELSPSAGWKVGEIETKPGISVLVFARGDERVIVSPVPNEPGVSVSVSRPATFADRCGWLLEGAKTYPPR